MIDLSIRSTQTELLDQGVSAEEAARSLGDLRFVDAWLGGGSLRRAVRPFLEASTRPTLLDAGCGSADVTAALARKSSRPVLAIGVDLKAAHLRQAPASVCGVLADVRHLPFAPGSFDVVTASLFLHHFDAPEVASVLRSLYALARRALIVSDLHRALVPYLFGRAVFRFLFRSPVSVHDGLVSIRRAFKPHELRAAFVDAGVPRVRIRRTFPYRLLAVAEKRL